MTPGQPAKCVTCGAQLDSIIAAAGGPCRFCGTLNAPAGAGAPRNPYAPIPSYGAAPGYGPGGYPYVPPRRGGGAGCIVGLAIAMLAIVGMGAAFFVLLGSKPAASGDGAGGDTPGVFGGGGSTLPSNVEWDGTHGAILYDVNGDGVPDLLGRVRYLGNDDKITLGAFDGTSGKKLWESASLGTYDATYQGKLGLDESTLLFAKPGGGLASYGAKDGKAGWTATLTEKVESFCRSADGQVAIRLANQSFSILRLDNGQAGSAPAPVAKPGAPGTKPDACVHVWSDDAKGDPGVTIDDEIMGELKVDGMEPEVSVQRGTGPKIVLGYRQKGTSVPMMAAIFPDASKNWQSDMPAKDPLLTSASTTRVGAVNATGAFATYGFQSGGEKMDLVGFDLAGHRLWDVPLPEEMPLTAVQSTDTKVLVSQWGMLSVYDATSGKQLFAIGKGFLK
jgi:hypothetical protein